MGNAWWDVSTNKEIVNSMTMRTIKHMVHPPEWFRGWQAAATFGDAQKATGEGVAKQDSEAFASAIDWYLDNKK